MILKKLKCLIKAVPSKKYMLKINNRITRMSQEKLKICSKLKIKTPESCQWRRSRVFIINFEHVFYTIF